MKLFRGVAAILLCTFLSNCKQGRTVNSTNCDTSKKVEKTQHLPKAVEKDTLVSATTDKVALKYGFTLIAGHNKGTGKFKTSDFMEVWHDKLKIFRDTSELYVFDEKHNPMLNHLKPNVFELLIPFLNGPSKDLVTFLRIENNKVVRQGQLPTFDTKPEKINGILTYHSIWDYGEMWDENGKRYTAYNPEIYYILTSDGIKLDTALTILKCKQKYGRFDGITYKGTIGYPCDDRGNITDTTAKNVFRKVEDN
jgi:hypothetical protein